MIQKVTLLNLDKNLLVGYNLNNSKKGFRKGKVKLINILNDCINIEDYIKNLFLINDNIKKCNSKKDIKIEFYFEDKFIDNFKENINFSSFLMNKQVILY